MQEQNKVIEPNQLHPELLAQSALQPWDGANSSGRKYMFSGHISQSLAIAEPTEVRTQTGMERQYGKYTCNIKMPEDGRIIKILDMYPHIPGVNDIDYSPLSLVLYENELGSISCFELQDYHYNYFYYGFKYNSLPGLAELREGNYVAKDTIFKDSTAISENGAYSYGRECNVAFMSRGGTAEDGFIISADVLPKFGYRTYERRTVSWGKDKLPINLYGDENHYKPFPDIGEYVHPHDQHKGLLMALRRYDEDLAVIDQNKTSVQYPDIMFDECIYATGAGGKVVDIRINHDAFSVQGGCDEEMSTQPMKYDKARRMFYTSLISEYNRLRKERGADLHISQQLHRWLVEAYAVTGEINGRDRVEMTYRKRPMDEWCVEFTIEYDHLPSIGSKLTDRSGGKGVICTIADPASMPVDSRGVRADIIVDPNTTASRMNLARLFETYINSASEELERNMKAVLGVTGKETNLRQILSSKEKQAAVEECWNRLMDYYGIITPRQRQWMTDGTYTDPHWKHLYYVIKEGIHLHIPTDNEPEYLSYIRQIEEMFTPNYGPVTWMEDGEIVQSVGPIRISSMYFMLLEKTGSDWSSTASGRMQQHGILAPLNAADKHSSPVRNQPTRSIGEAEVRGFVSYIDPMTTAEILDRNNNPDAHKQIVHNILNAKQPTNIDRIIDRNQVPLGSSKVLQIVKHIAYCSGYVFTYADVNKLSSLTKTTATH